MIEYVYGRIGVAPPLTPSAVAMGINSLFEGVKLTMLSSPGNMTAEDAESVLSLFVDLLMHLVRPQGANSNGQHAGGG